MKRCSVSLMNRFQSFTQTVTTALSHLKDKIKRIHANDEVPSTLTVDDSKTTIIFVSYVFLWLAYWITLKPFALLPLLVVTYLIRDAWSNFIWPEITISVADEPKTTYFKQCEDRLINQYQFIEGRVGSIIMNTLKQKEDNKSLFCFITSITLLIIAVMGSYLPGIIWSNFVFLLCCIAQTRWFSKALYYFTPPAPIDLTEWVPQLPEEEDFNRRDSSSSSNQTEDFEIIDSVVPDLDELSN